MSGRLVESRLETIEPFHLAAHGRILEGRLAIRDLVRLHPLIQSTEGEVAYHLEFDRDASGIPCVTGRVEATLILQCQRCMQDMPLTLSSNVRLGIVRTREAAEQLPGNFEPLLVGEGEISIASIVEDELILALPIVAMHRPEDCAVDTLQAGARGDEKTDTAAERQNPFAILETLKKDLNRDGAPGRANEDED